MNIDRKLHFTFYKQQYMECLLYIATVGLYLKNGGCYELQN